MIGANEYFTLLWRLLETKLIVLLMLTAIDFVIGTLLALVRKKFQWEYLTHYLTSDILPIFAWVGVVLLSTIPPEVVPTGFLPIASDAVYTTIFLSIAASIMKDFAAIGVLQKPLEKIGIRSDNG